MLHQAFNKLLDYSIYFSFDHSGFVRHQKEFQKEITDDLMDGPLSQHLEGKVALITGGTSGIGYTVTEFLSDKKVSGTVVGRTLKENNDYPLPAHFHFFSLDMSDWANIPQLVEQTAPVDYLVLNAGGMPHHFQVNAYGVELQFASQLFGHYILLKKLIEKKKLKPGARVVWVTSGGMYMAKLSLSAMRKAPEPPAVYDKVRTYALVKRAQVIAVEEMVKDPLFASYDIQCMHPGWVDTPGVREAIPGFWDFTKNRLRSPMEGADTILWLLLRPLSTSQPYNGKLWFDRQIRSPYAAFFPWTKEMADSRKKLMDELNQASDLVK